MDYVLRLQSCDGYSQMFSNVFNDRFSRVLCVPHTGRQGDNPHYHFAFTCDYKQPALRAHLKKYFDKGSGNRHLSLKKWDGSPKACSYMFHEGTDVFYRRGFSDEEINVFKVVNDNVRKLIKKNAPAQIVQDATEFFHGKDPAHSVLFMWIMNRLMKNGDWLPNKFQIERWIMRIQANLKDAVSWKSYLVRLYEHWYGDYSYTG